VRFLTLDDKEYREMLLENKGCAALAQMGALDDEVFQSKVPCITKFLLMEFYALMLVGSSAH
jgi:hypothetical protein